jgi:endo-1,4-beta-xylanase
MRSCVKCRLVLLTVATLAALASETLADVPEEARKGIERYRKGEVTIDVHRANGEPVVGAQVIVRQVSHDFLFGNYIRPRHYTDQRYLDRFKELFNFIQLLEFNWGQYEPDEGKPQVEKRMDFIRQWGIPNGFENYYGHMLVWTRQYGDYPRTGLPLWLFRYDKPKQFELLRHRIEREVTAYRDIEIFWDVVNEASHCRVWGDWDKDSYIQNRKAESFDRVLAYVTDALNWAHQANPNARLLINDYRVIIKSPFQRRFKQLIDALQAGKIPLHAVGIQAHEPFKGKYWYSPQELWDAYDLFGTETGLPIYITEYFQVSDPSQAIRGVHRSGKWSEESQADAIEEFYRISFGHPSVEAIVYFGLLDTDVVQPHCGLLDENYNPKTAWNRLNRLIWDEWTTEMSGKTNTDGTFKFRGFYGYYNLKTQAGGQTTTSNIHVDKGAANRFTIRVP